MSRMFKRARFTASGMAATGPTPIMAGSTPTTANDSRVAMMGSFRRIAVSLDAIKTAAAPSLT